MWRRVFSPRCLKHTCCHSFLALPTGEAQARYFRYLGDAYRQLTLGGGTAAGKDLAGRAQPDACG
jgi:hypothetical protein